MVSIIDRVRGRSDAPMIPEPEPEDIFEEMTLQEHLEELRQRILYAAIAIAIAFVAGLIAALPLLELMADQSGLGELFLISPTESFTTFMKVAFYIAVALAMPVLIYQLVAFLGPGLTREERTYVKMSLPFVSALFIAGVLFAFFVVIPRALTFLSQFGDNVFTATFRANEVITFYLMLMLWLGLVFELPVVIFIMAKLRVVTPRQLSSIRKYVLIGVMVAAAIITPTPDPFTMLLVAGPMYVLYEVGLILARVAISNETEATAGGSDEE